MDLFRFGGVPEVQYVLRSLERQSQGEGNFGGLQTKSWKSANFPKISSDPDLL
jgi:hypothetical protein